MNRVVRRGTLLAIALVSGAFLAGCSTTPAKSAAQEAAERDARVQANLRAATQDLEVSTAASLAGAAEILAREEARSTTAGAALADFGGRLYSSLYADLQNPFPPQAGSSSQSVPEGSKFFQEIGPALSLLTQGQVPDDETAGDLFDRLTNADDLNRDSVLPPYLRAILLQRQRRPPMSVRQNYEECLRRDSSFYPAKMGIIQTVIDEGTAQSQISSLLKYAGELPSPAASQAATVRIYLAAGQPRKAADAAARALLLSPDSSQLIVLRARAFEDMGDWYQAMSILDGRLRVRPDDSQAIAMKARLLFEKAGNPDAAMKMATEAQSKFPNDPAFPELRGRILLARGNSVEGDAALEQALTLDPMRVSTLSVLADSAARAERWQEAAGYLERIPDWQRSAEILQLGWQISIKLGDYDKALALAQANEKKAGGEPSLLLRVRTLVAAGRSTEAKDLAAADLRTATMPSVRASLYLLRALAEGQAGADEGTILADLRSALLENPDDPEALLAMADELSAVHEYHKALGYLKRAQELSPDDAAIRARVHDISERENAQP